MNEMRKLMEATGTGFEYKKSHSPELVFEDTMRLQRLAGIIKNETNYIPNTILSEAEEKIFESFWSTYITEGDLGRAKTEVENALAKKYKDEDSVSEVSNSFFNAVKLIVKSIWSGLKGASAVVFVTINKLVWWIISNILTKPLNALMLSIGGLSVALYKSLISVLNVGSNPNSIKIPFTDSAFRVPSFNPGVGDKLHETFMNQLASSWDNFIKFIQSYEPSGVVDMPVKIILEIIAAGLKAVGLAVPAVLESTMVVANWLLSLGLSNVATIVSWLYLIGGASWLFEKAKPYIVEPVKLLIQRQLPIIKDEMKEATKDADDK